MEDIMKVKMKKTLIGAVGNGETTITYEEGMTYEMKTPMEMQMAGVWVSDGRAEQATDVIQKKVIKPVESKAKKVVKKIFGKKKK
tara:strand:+ start:884 stop:1138 length:255 start_codon:yes stop_codon:yes gene_type:complete